MKAVSMILMYNNGEGDKEDYLLLIVALSLSAEIPEGYSNPEGVFASSTNTVAGLEIESGQRHTCLENRLSA